MEFYTSNKFWLLLINGVSFHMQSVMAYLSMSFISPVTFRLEMNYTRTILKCKLLFFSVTNTAKRALLIWTSILMFHNPVTVPSAVGTGTVIVGVFLYQQALSFESRSSTPMPESPQTTNTYVKPP